MATQSTEANFLTTNDTIQQNLDKTIQVTIININEPLKSIINLFNYILKNIKNLFIVNVNAAKMTYKLFKAYLNKGARVFIKLS